MNYLKEFNKSRRAEHFGTSCLASLTLGHITADKRLRFASLKFASQTSFIRNTLSEMPEWKER